MNCNETMTVNAKAVNWLKEKYPELCIKAGLCERVAGRLYTKTFTTPPAAQRQWVGLTDEEIDSIYEQHHNQYAECISVNFGYERAIEAKLKEKNT